MAESTRTIIVVVVVVLLVLVLLPFLWGGGMMGGMMGGWGVAPNAWGSVLSGVWDLMRQVAGRVLSTSSKSVTREVS